MVSVGNKAKLVSSDICQGCGKCCKEFTMVDNMDFALRFMWMENRKIKAKDTPFLFSNGDAMKSIIFKFPCSQLEFRDGKYRCKKWNEDRPNFCNTYPDHIFYNVELWNEEKIRKIIESSEEDCPAMKHITVDDVIEMLKERRGS